MVLTLEPPPALRPFVLQLWWCDEEDFAKGRETVLPHGRSQLHVALAQGGNVQATFLGAATRAAIVEPSAPRRMVGAVFRPEGAYALTQVCGLALRDRMVDVCDLWGGAETRLYDEVSVAASPEAAMHGLARFLLARRPHATRELALVARASQALSTGASVAHAIEQSGASRSRFVRLFASHVGMSPKTFSALMRFQRAVRTLVDGPHDLAQLARGCGYFDQPHFNREFRRFAGRAPTEYRPRDPGQPNHAVD